MRSRLLHLRAGTAAVFLLLLFAGAASAQGTLGRLAGTVLDTSGAVLPGVTVTITHEPTNSTETGVTNEVGAYVFPQLRPGPYTVKVELAGFRPETHTGVLINVGQETSLTVRLQIGDLAEVITVEGASPLVKTTTPEVSQTVLQKQVLEIPLANRDVTNLIKLQPGVQGMTNRTNTSINGGRPTWTQVTLDGINIQDNFIRTNSLDFLPNRPTSDNVAEFSITTAVSGAESAGGASSVRMITPSGSNTFRGSVFEFNRDNKYAANSFFNNSTTPKTPKNTLKRHQFGGRLGGPILRNRLFFFGYYEGFRQTTQTSQNLTIPANPDFFNGVFRYVALDGTVRSVNVLQLSGLSLDRTLQSEVFQQIPGPSNVNNYLVGNSRADRILNTAGYRFNQTDENKRDQYGFRVDYEMNTTHRFEGGFHYFKEVDDRTDLDRVSPDRPLVYTSSDPKRFALAWRWLASSNFQNEVRGGGNLAPVGFFSDWVYGGNLYQTALSIVNPQGGYGTGNNFGFQDQGRYTDTYQLSDNASWMLGSHELQMGGSWQRNRVNPYNYAGQYPIVSFNFSSAAPSGVALTTGQFPGGVSAADLANANAMLAWLSGTITSVSQTFQVQNATSGYVPGIPSNEHYTFDNIAAYLQDNWRWKPNLTIRAGLKWEYYSPLSEDENLGFLPVINARSIEDVMLDPGTTLTFTDGDYWKKDLNNFGPTVGFAWDVTKDGRTAVRGGYSLTFVNEETVTAGRAAARGNAGLSTTRVLGNQYTTVSAGVPVVGTPSFLTTRTLADQVALSNTSVLWGIDPNIKSPHVHQVSVGIQRELPWHMAAEARFVGQYGREIWRGIDYNQVQTGGEFLADFNRARSNGFLAQAAGLAFSPVYNQSVPGSQPLTVLPTFGAAFLTNPTVVTNIQTNQVGSLADFYLGTSVSASVAAQARQYFVQNPGTYAAQALLNGGFLDYNSLQLSLRRQYRDGFFGEVNYTFADSLTDSAGQAQNRFEAFMDNARPELDTGRAQFHVTHVINANAIYELPFGEGRRWLNKSGLVNAIVGDWQIGTIFIWQSGSPVTIFSGRGTFNRAGRSGCAGTGCNTALATLSGDEIKKLLGLYQKPDGTLYWIDPKVIDPNTGRAVGADNLTNATGFEGQVFFNPVAGDVGNLELLSFDGPSQFRIDLALSKRFRFGSRYNLEFKGEAFNLTNTPSWYMGDMDINSQTFGKIDSVNVGSRVVQLSLRFNF